MSKFDEFISWESTSRDTIDFKKTYVDMAGDVLAGLVLSEIIFWYLPNKQGQSKLRIKKEKMYWIACPRHEWWNRCRLSPRQIDRCFSILVKKGLIEKKRFRFNNAPTIHIRILEDAFMEQFNALIANPPVNPFLPNGEIGINENVKSDFNESGNSLTETTAETTKEKDFASPIGNAAGGSKNKRTEEESPVWWMDVIREMTSWPGEFKHSSPSAGFYLNGLMRSGTLNSDMDWMEVLAIVKQALSTPPDAAKEQLIVIDHDKAQRYEHKRILKCSLCGEGYDYHYSGDWLDAYSDTGWEWSDANEMICIDCAQKLEDEKEDDTLPDAAAQHAPEAKAKKERKPNPIFDAVAVGSFGLEEVNGDKTAGARIGKIAAWLKKQPGDVTAEMVMSFYAWYDRVNNNTARPRDVGKFAEHWLKWQASGREVPPKTNHEIAMERLAKGLPYAL